MQAHPVSLWRVPAASGAFRRPFRDRKARNL